MKKKLSILLVTAMMLALASCGGGDQTSAGSTSSTGSVSSAGSVSTSSSEASSSSSEASSASSAATSGSDSSASSASSSEEPDLMDTLNWTSNLPDPGDGITYVELNDADTVMQIYMDENWTAESAKAYVAQCLELGFELWDEAEPAEGIYYSEGYNEEEQKGFMVTCGFEGADIVLTYGAQMYFY